MSDNHRRILTSVIPAITEVLLYEETIEHVIQNHPEFILLPSIIQAVEKTVVNPTSVFQRSASTFVYSDDETTNRSGDSLLVPVKVVQGTSARVRTFYFASTENFATVIWRKSNG